jgi:phosphoribosylanthranilate isomerase
MSVPFNVKICGVQRVEDLELVSNAGADAIGLNFYRKSIRYISETSARELSREAKRCGLHRVGVFVNESMTAITRIAKECSLDAIQLHGDESVEEVQSQRNRIPPIIRAIRLPLGPLSTELIARVTEPWLAEKWTLLFDADAGSEYGGSGLMLDWASLRIWSELEGTADWILAGGLTPANVAQALLLSGARAVDVASGVECPKGTKSAQLIQEFMGAVNRLIR